MKKVLYVLCVLSMSVFFSCEPESIAEENEINEGEVYTVDRSKIQRPGSQGSGN